MNTTWLSLYGLMFVFSAIFGFSFAEMCLLFVR